MSERLADYDFVLPPELIAQEPLADRAASRLLTLSRSTGAVGHRSFRDLPNLLEPGDLLVMNDTRVSALRLFGTKATGARVEALLLNARPEPGAFVALVRPGKRLPPGTAVDFGEGLGAVVDDDLGEGRRVLRFEPAPDLEDRLRAAAAAPLPPYIRAPLRDLERYQTVYAREAGSAAAPTAGLHFTPALLDAVRARGVETATVTLHVGLDTFRPVSAETADAHAIHGEVCAVPPAAAEAVARCRGRVVAVGTTTVRTLETMAVADRRVAVDARETRIFITPGYRFRVVDAMVTNFHLPRTTMLLMVAALCGREPLMRAYADAIAERYRFLSFGDAMFVHP